MLLLSYCNNLEFRYPDRIEFGKRIRLWCEERHVLA